ncbi:MAG: hypothetical protein ABH851_09460 [Methanobacteriota archaeon]
MNSKKLKKIIKRETAKGRAQKQTARRRTQLSTNKNKELMTQDIYSQKKKGSKDGDNQEEGEYTLRKYNYNMFESGDPYATNLKSSATTSMNKRQRKTWNQAKKDQESTARTQSTTKKTSQKATRRLSTLS